MEKALYVPAPIQPVYVPLCEDAALMTYSRSKLQDDMVEFRRAYFGRNPVVIRTEAAFPGSSMLNVVTNYDEMCQPDSVHARDVLRHALGHMSVTYPHLNRFDQLLGGCIRHGLKQVGCILRDHDTVTATDVAVAMVNMIVKGTQSERMASRLQWDIDRLLDLWRQSQPDLDTVKAA